MIHIISFIISILICIYVYVKVISKINIIKLHISNLLLVLLIGTFVCLIIIFPRVSFSAAASGINLWFNIVLPSLLPFFIGSELLIGLGFVNFLGALFEPFMRAFFNVPGTGSFALAMGMTSGYPTGARITASLREKGLCTKTEGERLLTFTNNSGPLFIIGAVAVGMFDNPHLGFLLAISHYTAALTVGFLFRFYKRHEKAYDKKNLNTNIFRKAFKEMFIARKKDGRSFGILFGDSVKNSMNLLLIIGGFITFFSVLLSIFSYMNILSKISLFLSTFLKPFGINESLINATLCGFFELTIGCKSAVVASAEYIKKVVTVAVILGWAGFSVHFQVISIISKTDLSIVPYLCAKLLQSIIAGIYTYSLFTCMSYFESISVFKTSVNASPSWVNYFINSSEILFLILSVLIIISFVTVLTRSTKIKVKKNYQ